MTTGIAPLSSSQFSEEPFSPLEIESMLIFWVSRATSAGEVPLLFQGGKDEKEIQAFLARELRKAESLGGHSCPAGG
jgi:hypothetical protein